jgi:hypothetical protein
MQMLSPSCEAIVSAAAYNADGLIGIEILAYSYVIQREQMGILTIYYLAVRKSMFKYDRVTQPMIPT